jgi:putative membrane protein
MRRGNRLRMGIGIAALSVATAWAAGAGCSDSDNDNLAAAGGTGGFTGTGTRNNGTAGTTAASGGTGGTTVVVLNDGQIAAVMVGANSGEVQAAQVALSRSGSDNSAVRTFATTMVTDHNAANARLQALLQSENITAEDSSQRQALATQAAQTVNTLWATPDATFNAVYAQSQVTIHQMVMQLLQNQLIPAVQNAALKSELQAELTAVMGHLTQAQQLAAMFPSATPTTTDGGTAATGAAGQMGSMSATGTAGQSGSMSGTGATAGHLGSMAVPSGTNTGTGATTGSRTSTGTSTGTGTGSTGTSTGSGAGTYTTH